MKIIKILTKELKEIGLVMVFFIISFGLILLLIKLLLNEYSIEFYVFSKIIISSLIAAKVVVIINKTPLVHKLRHLPLYINVLYKTVLYTVISLSLSVIEKLFHTFHETKSLSVAIETLIHDANFNHILAVNLLVCMVFLLFNILNELDIYLGTGSLYKIFFSAKSKQSK